MHNTLDDVIYFHVCATGEIFSEKHTSMNNYFFSLSLSPSQTLAQIPWRKIPLPYSRLVSRQRLSSKRWEDHIDGEDDLKKTRPLQFLRPWMEKERLVNKIHWPGQAEECLAKEDMFASMTPVLRCIRVHLQCDSNNHQSFLERRCRLILFLHSLHLPIGGDSPCHSTESISMPHLSTMSIWKAITIQRVFFFDFLFFTFPLLPLSNAVNNNIHSFLLEKYARRKKLQDRDERNSARL